MSSLGRVKLCISRCRHTAKNLDLGPRFYVAMHELIEEIRSVRHVIV